MDNTHKKHRTFMEFANFPYKLDELEYPYYLNRGSVKGFKLNTPVFFLKKEEPLISFMEEVLERGTMSYFVFDYDESKYLLFINIFEYKYFDIPFSELLTIYRKLYTRPPFYFKTTTEWGVLFHQLSSRGFAIVDFGEINITAWNINKINKYFEEKNIAVDKGIVRFHFYKGAHVLVNETIIPFNYTNNMYKHLLNTEKGVTLL